MFMVQSDRSTGRVLKVRESSREPDAVVDRSQSA
jgi:hypothetical protein